MSDLYGMRRANGDWFVLEDRDRLRVPLFRSSHDALMARLRNFGMLLFEPVALDARLIREIAPVGASNVDFCLVKDPFASLKRSTNLGPAQLALLTSNSEEPTVVPRNGNGFHVSVVSPIPQRSSPDKLSVVPRNGNSLRVSAISRTPQSEWWN